MNTSARTVRFDDVTMWVDLSDGHGLHWESIDEDISIEGLLAGRGDMTRQGMAALLPA